MEGINMVNDRTIHSVKGTHYKSGKSIEIMIKHGRIDAIHERKESCEEDTVIAPGLVDLQINGYKGYDFNKRALIKEEWEEVIQHLLHVGVATFYPTIITNANEHLSTIFKENMKVLLETDMFNGVVGGFHLEGPYLSLVDGPRGAHERNYIKAPDWEEFCRLQDHAQGQIRIVTVSPEWEGSAEFIQKATQSGVIVAIGHTAANSSQIHEAVKAGAVLSTHLGNGAHVTLPRHPNYIWDQLAEDNLWASVISDGHHLPNNVLKVFQKVKDKQMILVSDSVAIAGTPPGDYETTVGGEVTLTENGRLHLKHEPNLLAGSAQNLLQGVQHCIRSQTANTTEAIKKASIYPATLMGLPVKDGIAIGSPADLITINQAENEWKVEKVFKNGRQLV